MKEENKRVYIIPKNYEDSLITANGTKFRNVVEASVLFLLIAALFFFIPMNMRIKIVLIVVIGGGLSTLGYAGINHRSLLEYIRDVINFKSSCQCYETNDNTIQEKIDSYKKRKNDDKDVPITRNVIFEDNSSKNIKNKKKGGNKNAKYGK